MFNGLLISFVSRYRKLEQLLAGLSVYLAVTFTIGSLVIAKLPFVLLPYVNWLVGPGMPGYTEEFDGPKPDLVFYQIIGLVIVPFVTAFLIVWMLPPSEPKRR